MGEEHVFGGSDLFPVLLLAGDPYVQSYEIHQGDVTVRVQALQDQIGLILIIL